MSVDTEARPQRRRRWQWVDGSYASFSLQGSLLLLLLLLLLLQVSCWHAVATANSSLLLACAGTSSPILAMVVCWKYCIVGLAVAKHARVL